MQTLPQVKKDIFEKDAERALDHNKFLDSLRALHFEVRSRFFSYHRNFNCFFCGSKDLHFFVNFYEKLPWLVQLFCRNCEKRMHFSDTFLSERLRSEILFICGAVWQRHTSHGLPPFFFE